MKTAVFVVFVLLAFTVCVDSQWTGNRCSRIRWRTVYRWQCVYRTWMGCCSYGWVCVTERYTEYFCCNGWTHNGYRNCNIPVCSMGCANGGTCIAPDTCQCAAGYEGWGCRSVSPCSHLKPCYPGYCEPNGACRCTNGYTSSTCLTLPNRTEAYPHIDQSTVNFAYLKRDANNMTMYEYSVDATMSKGTEVIWTNRREFNFLNYTFRALYKDDYDTLLQKPNYVSEYKIGIVEAKIFVYHSKLNQPDPFSKEYVCNGVSYDNPIVNDQLQCEVQEPNYNYRFDNADELEVTFSAKTGGIRSYRDSQTTHNYAGFNSTKKLHFKFDLFNFGGLPYHCSENSGICGSNDRNLLLISEDVTKNNITIRWGGWRDALSGVARYAWEVYKLQVRYDGKLSEPQQSPNGSIPTPLKIEAVNDSDLTEYPVYSPPGPGVYSVILEVGDKANNTVYARRFVLYDPVSDVTTNSSFPMFVSTANFSNGKRWQTTNGDGAGGTTIITTMWRSHFQNKLHENGRFLEEIAVFSHTLSDMSIGRHDYKKVPDKYDDFEGKRNRSKINNIHGIVSFEMALSKTEDPNPDSLAWRRVPLEENVTINEPGILDGDLVTVMVKATDILGNSMTDSTVVYFDSSKPIFLSGPQLKKNRGDNPMIFESIINLTVTDVHSAVYKVEFVATGRYDINFTLRGEYQNPIRSSEYCSTKVCDKLPGKLGDYYARSIEFVVNNCDLMVEEEFLNEEILDIEFFIYNGASLVANKSIELHDLTSLRGVNQFYGPMDIRVTSRGPGSARVTWNLPPTCYPRYGLMLFVSRSNGTHFVDVDSQRIHKDAESTDITQLRAGDKISMLTKYGTNENDITMSDRNYYSAAFQPLQAEQQSGSNGGTIAGVIVAIILLIAVAAFIVVMWRTGKVERLRSWWIERDSPLPFSNAPVRVEGSLPRKSYENRAYSDNFEDDIYLYGGKQTESRWIIPRKCITLEEEITRGRFAVIYKARYSSDTVVAKTLKDQATEEDIMTMKAKSNFLSELGEHPNLLKFIGMVEDDGLGLFMVLEYCEKGPMNTYLAKNKSQVNDDMHERLFKFSFEICKGMNYLASRKHVHRRLAARNVLLTFTLQAKITGFGPAPPDHDEEDGGEKKREKIPVKWMAPECINSTKHATEKSDVWSYGVVLWEIFSMGETPYPNVRSNEIASRLRKGERMRKPEHADDTFYGIMKSCWEYDEKKRPNFEDLLDRIEGMFKSTGDDFYYDQNGLHDNRQ